MHKALTLSIVIPVYNEQSHLAACLDSIAAQSNAPDEVIVVDNNSTDGTRAIAKQYKFVRLLSANRQGVYYARNRGFDAVTGKIIGRIDADSRLRPDWVAKVKKIFRNGKLAAATGPVAYYDMPLVPVGQRLDEVIRGHIQPSNDQAILFGTNMAIRTTAWQEVRRSVCNQTLFEDVDLTIHLHHAAKAVRYDKRMVAEMSSRRLDDSPLDFYKYIQAYKETYNAHNEATPLAARKAMAAYLMLYPVMKPWRYMYNPETERLSLSHLLWPNLSEARKNP